MRPPRIKFFLVAHKGRGLSKGPEILQRNLRGGLTAMGKRLQASARKRMRKDTGEQIRNLTYKVRDTQSGLNLLVYSTLIQAFVDAYGLRRGVFPPFRAGTKLYAWAKRKVDGRASRRVRTVGTPAGPAFRAAPSRRRQIKKVKRVRRDRQVGPITSAQKRARVRGTDARRLAFLAARAIYRRGIAATGWPQKTLQANRDMITRELKNALSRSANEMRRSL